jgi:nicotinate-nucleotide pyrophosphorylase (carboxylating)
LGEKNQPAGSPRRSERAAAARDEPALHPRLQRLCGVATHTREHVLALGSSPTKLLDTRKTTPGFRMLEKYAVGQGGGHNHRLGLFDRIMVKDNHLAAGGATAGERITKMVRRARESRSDLLVEVEVDRLDQIAPVLAAGADIILLDHDLQVRKVWVGGDTIR